MKGPAAMLTGGWLLDGSFGGAGGWPRLEAHLTHIRSIERQLRKDRFLYKPDPSPGKKPVQTLVGKFFEKVSGLIANSIDIVFRVRCH